jgi:hypothetical protein
MPRSRGLAPMLPAVEAWPLPASNDYFERNRRVSGAGAGNAR